MSWGEAPKRFTFFQVKGRYTRNHILQWGNVHGNDHAECSLFAGNAGKSNSITKD